MSLRSSILTYWYSRQKNNAYQSVRKSVKFLVNHLTWVGNCIWIYFSTLVGATRTVDCLYCTTETWILLTEHPGRGDTEFIANVIREHITIYCMHFTNLNRRCIFFQLFLFQTQQFCLNFYQEIITWDFFPTGCTGGGFKSKIPLEKIQKVICHGHNPLAQNPFGQHPLRKKYFYGPIKTK